MTYGVCVRSQTHTGLLQQVFNNKDCITITGWYMTLPHKHEMCGFFFSASKLSTFPSRVCVCADWFSTAVSVAGWLCSEGDYRSQPSTLRASAAKIMKPSWCRTWCFLSTFSSFAASKWHEGAERGTWTVKAKQRVKEERKKKAYSKINKQMSSTILEFMLYGNQVVTTLRMRKKKR